MPNLDEWVRFGGTFETDPNKHVKDVKFQIEVNDAVSSTNGVDRLPIYFTDVQFQAGERLTGWIPNTKEMMNRLTWTHNEWEVVANPNGWKTVEDPNPTNSPPPQIIENVNYRFYNLVGRGLQTVVIPNYYPQDWDVPVLPTGIDLTLYPKDDFDLLRISTSEGAVLPEDQQFYKQDGGIYQEMKKKYEDVTSEHYSGTAERKNQEISNWENIIVPLMEDHPLHKRYTREFYVDGAKAGTEILVNATTRTAKVNGKDVQIVGEHELNVAGTKVKIDRKKFMLAPKGTATIRIEFYKLKEREIVTYERNDNYDWVKVKKKFSVLEDVGIGYHGTAGFYQWTYRTRL